MTPTEPDLAKLSWLYIDMNAYFASVEQEVNPALRGKPVGVVPLLADTTCCIAASYEAKAYGIKTGTLVKDAKKLCPDIQFLLAQHELYIEYHHKIIHAVESCVPVDVVCSIDEIACRLSGSQQSVSIASELAKKIKSAICEKVGSSLRCSIGAAPNRFLAKVAADMKKPDGFTAIRKCDLPDILFSLQLRDFPGIGTKMERRLHQQSIFSVKKLCSLTPQQMNQAWGGVVGDRFWRYLHGLETHEETSKTKTISQSHILPPEFRNDAGALQTLKKLTAKAAHRLRRHQLWASGVSIYVKFSGDANSKSHAQGWGRVSWSDKTGVIETHDTLTLVHAVENLWQNAPPGTPLGVGVVLDGLVPDCCHTPSLFENPKQENISQIMDDINRRFGQEVLHFGATHDAEQLAPLRIAFTNIPEPPPKPTKKKRPSSSPPQS